MKAFGLHPGGEKIHDVKVRRKMIFLSYLDSCNCRLERPTRREERGREEKKRERGDREMFVCKEVDKE